MRISLNWINDFVDVGDLTPADFSELITTKVAEVEEVYELAVPVEDASVCSITKISPHPSNKTLSVVSVNVGGESIDLVCGAPNVEVDCLAVYLARGARYVANPGEGKLVAVEQKEIGGVESCGFLASEAELGLTAEHSGIFLLREASGIKPGSALSSVIAGSDTVLEIDNKSLTHRPDLWSHYGFAREISAILSRPLKLNADQWADDTAEGKERLAGLGSGKSSFTIKVEADGCCRRFSGVEFSNVSSQQSPLWMRRRLFAIGAGIRTLLIDLSNYVMNDIGQPNHAYDADLLSGETISARMAHEGEKFLGLDNVERTLSAKDIVIADQSAPVALGGVIGGATTSVCDSTTRLFLESANFDPTTIRKTTKRHQLRTDASNRFEKSLSANNVPLALHRFADLLQSIDSKAKITSAVVDDFPTKPRKITVPVTCKFIRERLGVQVEDERILAILTSLGFSPSREENSSTVTFVVPYYRATRDISCPEDLVEEVGRIYGYENIPEKAPLIESCAPKRDNVRTVENRIRDRLAGAGFREFYDYSFAKDDLTKRCGYLADNAVEIVNPVASDQKRLRTSLIPGLLEVAIANARFNNEFGLFELGRCYFRVDNGTKALPAIEKRMLSLCYFTDREESICENIVSPSLKQGAHFYALASVIRQVARLVCASPLELKPLGKKNSNAYAVSESRAWMHPYRNAAVLLDGKSIGVLAETSPVLIDGVNGRLILAELCVEDLVKAFAVTQKFQHVSKYPYSLFEMSIVMPKTTEFSELRRVLFGSAGAAAIKGCKIVAVYHGAPLADDQKSVSVKLALGADDRTISSEQLDNLQKTLVEAVVNSDFSLRT